MSTRRPCRVLALVAYVGMALTACGARSQLIVRAPPLDATTVTDSGPLPSCTFDASSDTGNEITPSVDLLVMVDNSNSMRDNQSHLMSEFGAIVESLLRGACVSPSNPDLHPCTGIDPNEMLRSLPLHDMNVGVVSSDLGTPGSSVPGCVAPDDGDDGALNPIRSGAALHEHEPWVLAPPSFGRPADCTDRNEFPPFLTFVSGVTNPMQFDHDFQCNAGLYVNGCGLESQLEAMYRALRVHDASTRAGNVDVNAGFLRDNALLTLLVLSDEEDGSVRNCRFPTPGVPTCRDALDVYNTASTAWSSANLNLRFYLYQPGSAQDPTWPLDRYIDPRNPNAGFPGLKPGHPERVLFAAITGVPLGGWRNPDDSVQWDALLGTPAPGSPDDFNRRDSMTSLQGMAPEGPFSMQQANTDPTCPSRTVPACRREGTTYNALGCDTSMQYFAWPARRIVEVARRFDQAPFCDGQPCHNGIVDSICANSYTHAIAGLVRAVEVRLGCE